MCPYPAVHMTVQGHPDDLLQSCRVGAAVRGTWRCLAFLWHATIFSPGALSMPPLTGLAIATDVFAG